MGGLQKGVFAFASRGPIFWPSLRSPSALGNPNGGLAKGGLARKGPIGPKRALSGQFLLFPRGRGVQRNWSRSAPKRPRPALKWRQFAPKRARFSRKDFPPIFSENLGLKPPFVSPPLDFPNPHDFQQLLKGNRCN